MVIDKLSKSSFHGVVGAGAKRKVCKKLNEGGTTGKEDNRRWR